MKHSIPVESPMVKPNHDEVLAALRLANAMAAACDPRNPRAVYAGRTIGDFIDAIFKLGLSVNDDLASIEFGTAKYGTGYLLASVDECGAAEIREMR